MSSNMDLANRPDYDQVIQDIADYVIHFNITSREAMETARHCLMDTLGCGLLALRFPECTKHLGPLVQGTVVPNGARVPGTPFILDPVKAAWDIAGWISTTPGWPQSGAILRTIWAAFLPWPITCPSSGWPMARRR